MKTTNEIILSKRVLIGREGIDGFSGEIHLPLWKGSVICSTGAGWEHVSVAPYKSRITPSWDDMCLIKDIFFYESEAVIQIHPPKSEYVNEKENCLHLWRCTYKEMCLPPAILVGIPDGMKHGEVEKAIKEAYEMAGEKYAR